MTHPLMGMELARLHREDLLREAAEWRRAAPLRRERAHGWRTALRSLLPSRRADAAIARAPGCPTAPSHVACTR